MDRGVLEVLAVFLTAGCYLFALLSLSRGLYVDGAFLGVVAVVATALLIVSTDVGEEDADGC